LLSSVGAYYYLYNEVAFLALDNVAPVTHAIGNTIKRVVIIVASVIAFGTKMTPQGVLGSSIAIAGVFLYSLAKTYFK
jgi:solute carrier family 35 protein E1